METQQKELMAEQATLEKLDSDLTQGLMDKQTAMNQQLYDTVMNYIKEYNKGQYMLILGNAAGSNILFAEPGMDITREIIKNLNERYAKTLGE
jgi:outer membrane protein